MEMHNVVNWLWLNKVQPLLTLDSRGVAQITAVYNSKLLVLPTQQVVGLSSFRTDVLQKIIRFG